MAGKIIITDDVSVIATDGWDYPVEEIPYLIETHSGEAFVYCDGRLYEAEGGEI